MSTLKFVKPKAPPLRAPWEQTVVYLPQGLWRWQVESKEYGKQQVNLATIPELNLMVFWNKICRMDVVYLKQNGVMKFRVLQDSTEIYQDMDRLIAQQRIPDMNLKNIRTCEEGGRIKAVEYLLRNTKHIIVNDAYLAFKDERGFIAVYNKFGLFPTSL